MRKYLKYLLFLTFISIISFIFGVVYANKYMQSQPTMIITYNTIRSDILSDRFSAVSPESAVYILNTNSHKIHLKHCSAVNNMSPENKLYVTDISAALNDGYVFCSLCKNEILDIDD